MINSLKMSNHFPFTYKVEQNYVTCCSDSCMCRLNVIDVLVGVLWNLESICLHFLVCLVCDKVCCGFVWQLNVEYHFPEDPRYFDINWNSSLPQRKKKACCFCWPSCT